MNGDIKYKLCEFTKTVFVPDKEEGLGWIGSNAIFSGHPKDLCLGGNEL